MVVGTIVRIKGPDINVKDSYIGWVGGMDQYKGQKGRIAKVYQKNGGNIYLIKEPRGRGWMMSRHGIPYSFVDAWLEEVGV